MFGRGVGVCHMRKVLGLVVLAAGVGGLALWASRDHANDIETSITADAEQVADTAIHEVRVAVSGRDITLQGNADSAAERDRLVSALNAIDGRRVVRAEMTLIPEADPFRFAATKAAGGLLLQGNVPSETVRSEILQAGGANGAEALTLASGAGPEWSAAVMAGLAALEPLDKGVFAMEDKNVRLSGLARTPVERDRALDALAGLPDGYSAETEFELRDDGKLPDASVVWTIAEGARLSGKLPADMTSENVAEALDLRLVADTAKTGLVGRDQKEALLSALRGLSPWLGQLDRAELRLDESEVQLEANATPGADIELLSDALRNDLPGVAINLDALQQAPSVGAERFNVLTERTERFQNGFWLPRLAFRADSRTCADQSNASLKEARIGFVSGSARLDPKAVTAVNRLASVVIKCVREAGLTAELGGHTDSTGEAQRNYELSYERALAVQAALAARGVPDGAMNAVGYGENKPIADNATAEGRAMNRRTTIVWFAGE